VDSGVRAPPAAWSECTSPQEKLTLLLDAVLEPSSFGGVLVMRRAEARDVPQLVQLIHEAAGLYAFPEWMGWSARTEEGRLADVVRWEEGWVVVTTRDGARCLGVMAVTLDVTGLPAGVMLHLGGEAVAAGCVTL
jgi:hypothetical protein